MRLSSFATSTVEIALAAGMEFTSVDPDLACAEKIGPSGSLKCHGQRLVCAAAELRIVLIESAKIQVLSCFIYPQDNIAQPLYAMELVQLGAKPIVAVLDAVAPPGDLSLSFAKSMMARAHHSVADLQNATDPPPWFQDCRSGYDFFVRPNSSEDLRRMGLLHLSLVSDYLLALTISATRDQSAAVTFAEFSRHYKDHHAANSPGLPLMEKSFGSAWTEHFMQQFFFR